MRFNIKAIADSSSGVTKEVVLLTMIIISHMIPFLPVLQESLFQIQSAHAQEQQPQQLQGTDSSSCITYDSTENAIRISCKHTGMIDIDNQLQNPDLLHKETTDGVWLLNAGIIIEQGATLYVNSTDTSWLKITPYEGNIANGIQVFGTLRIDSVKITSWNPEANDYVKFEVEKLIPEEGEEAPYDKVSRPYIRVETDATGTTDITNSELAYLGYEDEEDSHGRSGLLYYGGDGSIIKDNNIHHNRFGFYSSNVSHITIENNHIHNNYMYGLDPHTGTHDMIIRNNTVHDHGTMGIICSQDCFNTVIEDNEVYNSFGSGIMFSRNMYDSVARNNNVHDEDKCIFVSQSTNNRVYDNKVSNCETGIDIFHNSDNNAVYNNTISNSTIGIGIEDAGVGNEIHSNTIISATEKAVNIEDSDIEEQTILSNNKILG